MPNEASPAYWCEIHADDQGATLRVDHRFWADTSLGDGTTTLDRRIAEVCAILRDTLYLVAQARGTTH